jgi:diadenosine tetraphosphatase ApaH/serine/threonine PP2A family protein phosphatase
VSGRTIVVGDIHGCADELEMLLDKVSLKASDRVVSVGDLVTKGKKNREVLDRFIEDKRFAAVLGNHDRALRRYWRGEGISLKPAQQAALDELKIDEARYSTYLQELPHLLDLGEHLVVHAGIRPSVALDAQAVEDLTELRTLGEDRTNREGTPWYEVYDGEKIVLFGHWPAPEPRRARRAIGLDTGCVYGYQLTAYIVETGEFTNVQAREAYSQPKSKVQGSRFKVQALKSEAMS